MQEQTLEFRGIPVQTLIAYLRELGGAADSVQLPATLQGDGWQAIILREEMVTITSRFQVNAVFIRFAAVSEERLTDLLRAFRMKTMRVGG